MIVRLTTFGGLRGSGNGTELDWLGRKWLSTALLLFLALERRATREQLQAVFWPEADAATAGHRLNQALYALRRALGADCIQTIGSQLVAGEQLEIDALALESAVEQGRLLDAIGLYRGAFLSGVHLAGTRGFEEWVDSRRARYTRLYRTTCRRLVDQRLSAGDLAGALEIARRWVEPDPLDDEAQHRLIEALWRIGDRAGALAQYEEYARALSGEQLHPLEETMALGERIRTGEPPPGADAPEIFVEVEADRAPSVIATPAVPVARTLRRVGRRRIVLAAIGMIALGVVAMLQRGRLGPRDPPSRAWTILADFDGTANVSYRTAVREYVRALLDESKVVMSVPAEQVTQGLVLAGRAADTPVDSDLARELARRERIRTVVTGRLDEVGSTFSVSLRVIAAEDGTVLFAAAPVIAKGADALLLVTQAAANQLRRHLGERSGLLGTGRFQNLEMTPSFEAWQKFAAGMEAWERRLDRGARMDLMREAVAHDSAFASAWIVLAVDHGLNHSRDSTRFALDRARRFADRASELTRLRIEARVAEFDGDMLRALQVSDRMVQLFPNRPEPYYDRGRTLNWLGRFDESLEDLRTGMRLNPFGPRRQEQLTEVRFLLRLGRSEEAWEAARRLGTDSPWGMNAMLIAALGGSRWTQVERLITEFEPKLGELWGVSGPVHAARGRVRQAEALLRRRSTHQAIRLRILLASVSGLPLAPLDSVTANDPRVPALITRAYAAVVAGDTGQVRQLLTTFPHPPDASMEYGAWLRLVDGLAAQARGDPAGVLQLAPLARRPRGDFINHYQAQGVGRSTLQWFVARAFEATGRVDSAAAYYALITDPSVETLTAYANELSRTVLYSFAHQRLVVLNARLGRVAEARRHWRAFSQTFIDPDPELMPLVNEAREALHRAEQLAR